MMYRKLESELEKVPVTWLPALLAVLIRRVTVEKVFVSGGLEKFIKNRQKELVK